MRKGYITVLGTYNKSRDIQFVLSYIVNVYSTYGNKDKFRM